MCSFSAQKNWENLPYQASMSLGWEYGHCESPWVDVVGRQKTSSLENFCWGLYSGHCDDQLHSHCVWHPADLTRE